MLEKIDYLDINYNIIDNIIQQAILEDVGVGVGSGDHTTLATIPINTTGYAECLIKSDGIIAGIDFAKRVFQIIQPEQEYKVDFEQLLTDGNEVKKGQVAFRLNGSIQKILTCERVVLNVMQRMSGIATQTHKMVKILQGTNCQLLDTRKTTPLVRILEKWAVSIGGAKNHRMGLYDMILIKDNHIDASGGVINAITRSNDYLTTNNLNLPIVIETRTLDEVEKVSNFGGISRILLDNMSSDMMKQAIKIINGRFPTEASGNITLDNIREKAESGINYISTGALTHSFISMDISLKIRKANK